MAHPELVLHIGTHKTGTTAIQAHMSQCRAELAVQGVLWPSLRPGLWKDMDGHHKVASAIARLSLLDRIKLRRFRKSIDEAQAWARLTVMSAEPIYRHVVGRSTPDDLPEWFAAHRRYLDRLAHWLEGFDVRALVYFRQPDDLAISAFKEHVVRQLLPARDPSFVSFLDASAHYYRYSDHVAALVDSFPQVVVRDYAAARQRGLLADFASVIGAEGLPAPACVAVRQSPANRATLWLTAQPPHMSRRDYVRRLLFALRAGPDGPFHELERTTLWPDRATFDRFVERNHRAWDLHFITVPAWRGLPTARWNADDHNRAEQLFRRWESENLPLLKKREAGRLAFFEADPV